MNVTQEQLKEAHQEEMRAWEAFYQHDEHRKDPLWHTLRESWLQKNSRSHQLQEVYDAQQLLARNAT